MTGKRVMFSPVTRLEGLLSVEVTVDRGRVTEANASSTMFRGFEWIMRDRHVTNAVYMTQRVCGICSTAHGATASYLLDELYGNEIPENAQYLRNIMYAADLLQNHIRHFYLFSLPDFVSMPDRPPFQGQDLADARLSPRDNRRLVEHYYAGIKAAQQGHEILALFGGKAPHQHSFIHGGVTVAPTAGKINRALALANNIREFIEGSMFPDTELLAKVYNDYFHTGVTQRRLLSFGLFKFGSRNQQNYWKSGLLVDNQVKPPQLQLIEESVTSSWYEPAPGQKVEVYPAPYKQGAYTWVKSVQYNGQPFQVGPLARMIINGYYSGGTSTMDRVYARSLEARLLAELIVDWLHKLKPGAPPLQQNKTPIKSEVTATTDAMRGALLHSALVVEEEVIKYNIITPTAWNFSPKDRYGQRGPVEEALAGTRIPGPGQLYTVLGRIIRSFDPCLNCATHVIDRDDSFKPECNFFL